MSKHTLIQSTEMAQQWGVVYYPKLIDMDPGDTVKVVFGEAPLMMFLAERPYRKAALIFKAGYLNAVEEGDIAAALKAEHDDAVRRIANARRSVAMQRLDDRIEAMKGASDD